MKEGGATMASRMAGMIMKKKKWGAASASDETEKKQQQQQPKNRFSAMRKKVAEKTGLSLLPAVRRRNTTKSGKRYVKHSPFSRRSKQTFHGHEEEVVFVSPSTTTETDDEDDSLSPMTTTTMGESNMHLLEHYSGVIPTTPVLDSPLSDVQGQELFKSPSPTVEPKTIKLLEKPQHTAKSKKKVRFHFEEVQDKHDGARYVPLSSLSGVSPRTLETIVESTIEGDDNSLSSSSSSTDDENIFHVSFSPSNDLFARTLANERATALSMSEEAFKTSVRLSLDQETTMRSRLGLKMLQGIKSTIRNVTRRITLNDALGVTIVIMTLMNWTGASDHIIGNLQAFFRGAWKTGTTTTRTSSTLYDYEHDSMGVWLAR